MRSKVMGECLGESDNVFSKTEGVNYKVPVGNNANQKGPVACIDSIEASAYMNNKDVMNSLHLQEYVHRTCSCVSCSLSPFLSFSHAFFFRFCCWLAFLWPEYSLSYRLQSWLRMGDVWIATNVPIQQHQAQPPEGYVPSARPEHACGDLQRGLGCVCSLHGQSGMDFRFRK